MCLVAYEIIEGEHEFSCCVMKLLLLLLLLLFHCMCSGVGFSHEGENLLCVTG